MVSFFCLHLINFSFGAVFYYNTVTRVSVRLKPPDYVHDPLHIPKKAMYGMHFYH